MFDTNYFGAIRCIQAVLPSMRERRRGHHRQHHIHRRASSPRPNQIPYSASKWALECAGEALAHEVRRFGIRVVNIEPGVVMTSIFENSNEATRYDKTSPYQPIMRRNGKALRGRLPRARPGRGGGRDDPRRDPEPEYRLRWPVGKDALGSAEGRRRISDEAWVAMGDDLSDEEYHRRFADYFGITLK
jgi:NAD(P)-dependent dehydrogenase (short-subunit alcohol dehydrogenase family)